MKPITRNLLIAGMVITVLFLGAVGYGIWKIYSFFQSVGVFEEKEIPAEIQQARTLKDEGFFSKKDFFKLETNSNWETIKKGTTFKDEKERQKFIQSQTAKGIFGFDDIKICGSEIVAVGKFGGYVFDLNGNLQREILFEPKTDKIKILWYEQDNYTSRLGNLKIHDFEGDGECEFISYDSINGVTFFDSQGNAVWRNGGREINLSEVWEEKSQAERDKESWITGAYAGDLNNDGISEFIIAKKNDGIRAFDINKNEKWFQPDEFPTAEFKILDLDGDGKNEVLEFQGMGSTVRNPENGAVIRKLEIEGGTDGVLISENEDGKKKARFYRIENNKIIVSDPENKVLWESDAPLSEIAVKKDKTNFPPSTPIDLGNGLRAEPVSDSFGNDNERIYQPKAVFVRLQKNKPKFLAVVGSFIGIPRSHLYVYDEKGNLVFHELLPENAETIAALPTAEGIDQILVGGKNTIWKYSTN